MKRSIMNTGETLSTVKPRIDLTALVSTPVEFGIVQRITY